MSAPRPTRRQWLWHILLWSPLCLMNVLVSGEFVTDSHWPGAVLGLVATWWSGVRLARGPRV